VKKETPMMRLPYLSRLWSLRHQSVSCIKACSLSLVMGHPQSQSRGRGFSSHRRQTTLLIIGAGAGGY